jgi:hypothetical protein
MTLVVLVAALILVVALGLRERALRRERSASSRALGELIKSLAEARQQLRRLNEELVVIERVLEEKHFFDQEDLAQARLRLIEHPRRVAAERAAIATEHKVSPTQLVMDEDLNKVH